MLQSMDKKFEKMEETIELNYNNMLINKVENLKEEKDAEIRMLKLQIAKYRKDGDYEDEEEQQDQRRLDQDAEFRRSSRKQSPEMERGSEKRSMAARATGGCTMQFDVGSVGNMPSEEKFTDKQAQHIIRQALNGQTLALTSGVRMRVIEALDEIGTAQRQRAIEHINTQLRTSTNCPSGQHSDGLSQLLGSMMKVQHTDTSAVERISNAGSTAPKMARQDDNTQRRDGGEDDEDGDWVLSVIQGDGGRKGGGGDGGSNSGDSQNDIDQRDDRDGHNGSPEFTLVNSRNIEMKRFSGESGSKLTYLEFNESLREFISIKGRDGDVLNRILTWAENQADSTITDRQLEQLERKCPKYGNTIELCMQH